MTALVDDDATGGPDRRTTAGKAAEWHVEPHTIPNWTRTPVIGFSQVGYHPSQPKRAVIELDANDSPLPTAAGASAQPWCRP